MGEDKYKEPRDDDTENNGNCCERTANWFKEFPKATWPILVTEFAERFSYYGIKAVLTLYLLNTLGYVASETKTIYHAFSMTSYFTGVIGAMMADSLLGKFKTIAYSLVVYSLSEIALTLTSLPSIGRGFSIGPIISLFVLAIACGNIKPCLAAYGGVQFDQSKTRQLGLFFSMFYMSVNVGAMLCMYFIPIVRTDVQCYGGDCYPLVFGINTVLIIVATLAFVGGKRWYYIDKPEGNVMIRVFKIIGHAISRKCSLGRGVHPHWLDYASDEYDMSEINDIKDLLRVLVMYIPLPVFWALFHQQGSSWIIQAEQMDGDLGSLGTLRSDQMQALNPILVLILIPLYDSIIYPFFAKIGWPLSPLKKMTGGLILTCISFIICAFVQIEIQTVDNGPAIPGSASATLQFINAAPCDIQIDPGTFQEANLKFGSQSSVIKGASGLANFTIMCKDDVTSKTKIPLVLKEKKVYTALVTQTRMGDLEVKLAPMNIPTIDVAKAETRVRVLFSPANDATLAHVTLSGLTGEDDLVFKNVSTNAIARVYEKTLPGEYTIKEVKNPITGKKYKVKMPETKLKLSNFGAYTIVLHPQKDNHVEKLYVVRYEDAQGTAVSRLLQLPQYVVITAGEVMFSVTGLEFAYSQAPASMKSVLQSFWLVTVAFGDLVVMIFSLVLPKDQTVEEEMFLYGGLMGVVSIIFGVMSYFYKYVSLDRDEGDAEEKDHLTNGIPMDERSPAPVEDDNTRC